MLRFGNILVLAVLTGFVASCGRGGGMNDYIQTTKSGIERLPWPRQIEALYGDSDHFITEYGFASGPRLWNTEAFFYGRYSLTLQVDVDIDYHKDCVVTNVGPPTFYLHEVGSLIYNSRGLDGAKIAGNWKIDEAHWNKLVASKGDWSVLGIPIKTNSPIPDFDKYVDAERSPRVRIPH